LVLSFVLHIPFTPLGPLFGFLGLLTRLNVDVPDDPVEALEGIPVELLSAPPTESPTVAEGIPATDSAAVVIAPPKPKPKKPKLVEALDASVAEADSGTNTENDAGLADAEVSDAAIADASINDAGVSEDAGDSNPDAGAKKPDPFAIAGDFPKVPKSNVNVKIHLFATNLQKHPAGRAIASLLSSERQWQEFLGPSGLDPIADISRIVIYGPQLVDSSKVAIFLEYTRETKDVEAAVDALVKNSDNGHWSTENKKRVAWVTAASAERAIIFFPGKLIAIVPPGPVEEQLVLAKRLPSLPEPSDEHEVFQGALRTPYRVAMFKRLGIEIPKTISEAKLFVGTLPNGGAKLRLEISDESVESAQAHHEDLERQLSAISLGMVSPRWSVENSTIIAETSLSPLQVAGILSQINREIEAARRRNRQ
jgi:hypothetical protein